MFKVGDRVYVAGQDYEGEVIEVRDVDGDERPDYLVRYSVPFGRKPHYETWWPEGHLATAQEK